MEHHELYDKILRELPKDGSPADPGDYHAVDLHYLESLEYVELTVTAEGNIFVMRLTKAGMRFISEGGFMKQEKAKLLKEERAEIEFNWKKRDEKRKNTSTIFVVVTGIFALWNASIQYMNWNANWKTKENTKVQIDSIKEIVSLSQARIDSLSKIVNDNNTKNAIEDHNRNTNKPKGSTIKQR
jgi:hypothetical protein